MRILRTAIHGLTEGTVETKVLNGRDFLVVPVVALVEGVRHANGASSPELVPSTSFGRYPDTWNGRPVVVDHPMDEAGHSITASNTEVLERSYLGKMLNSKVEDGKLKTEAWLDLNAIKSSKSELVGEMWDRLDSGEVCEVSVGCIVYMKQEEGEYQGKKYSGVWDIVIPDHLAFLSSNQIGACSVDDGCGTFRTQSSGRVKITEDAIMAARALMSGSNGPAVKKVKSTTRTQPTGDKRDACGCGGKGEESTDHTEAEVNAMVLNRALFSSDLLDADKRAYLQRALDSKYKYCYVVAFSDNSVVFSKYEADSYKTYQLSYSSDEKENVTFSGEPTEVVFQAKVVPVGDSAEDKGSEKDMSKREAKKENGWNQKDEPKGGGGSGSEDEEDDKDEEEDDEDEDDSKSKKASSKDKGKKTKMSANANPQSVDDVLKSLEGTEVGKQLAGMVTFAASEKNKAVAKLLKAGGKHLKKETLEKMDLEVLQGMIATLEDMSGNDEDEDQDDEETIDGNEDGFEDDDEDADDGFTKANLSKSKKAAAPKKKNFSGKAGGKGAERRSAVAPSAPDVFAFDGEGSLKKEAA